MLIEVPVQSEDETMALGRRFSGLLRPGDIILLSGRLGAGKTRFVSGVAEGLGVDQRVTSPSFVLVKRYQGFLDLVHADAYRLGSLAEFEDLDLLGETRESVLVIEWGTAIAAALPADALTVDIEVVDDDARVFRFHAKGPWASRSLEELSE